MSCGGRVWKGTTVTISVPFDVEGYKNLTITYSTVGEEKIVKTQQEVNIEDGFISYTFMGDELDILPDGVIYYTIDYELGGEEYTISTNTPLYLKTPVGYSGKTAEDYYQEGYDYGLEVCGEECSIAVDQAYQSGYTSGATRNVILRFEFNGPGGALYGGSSIKINGKEADLYYFELTGFFDVYEAKLYTSEDSASTIELTIDYQNNAGTPLVVEEFNNILVDNAYDLTITSQSRELVKSEGVHLFYKYTFVVEQSPLYAVEAVTLGHDEGYDEGKNDNIWKLGLEIHYDDVNESILDSIYYFDSVRGVINPFDEKFLKLNGNTITGMLPNKPGELVISQNTCSATSIMFYGNNSEDTASWELSGDIELSETIGVDNIIRPIYTVASAFPVSIVNGLTSDLPRQDRRFTLDSIIYGYDEITQGNHSIKFNRRAWNNGQVNLSFFKGDIHIYK